MIRIGKSTLLIRVMVALGITEDLQSVISTVENTFVGCKALLAQSAT